VSEIKDLFKSILQANIPADAFTWLEEKRALNTAFVLLPRKTGKAVINITADEAQQIATIVPGFTVNGWTADRLGRAYLLLNLDTTDQAEYFRVIENLFLAAEIGELVALYSTLPLLAYPEIWVKRCAEGIRSNIANVLEAIMYHNPYPAQNLDQSAWNQLVLKAFFTDKDINKIIGIDTRANKELAYILSDYAHERWAAGREVNPKLWRLVGPFIDDKLFEDIKRLFDDGKLIDRQAGALAIAASDYPSAKILVNKYPELVTALENKNLSWDTLTGN
jgi:hypothetical protein